MIDTNIDLSDKLCEELLTYDTFEALFLLLGSLGESKNGESKEHIHRIQDYTRDIVYTFKDLYSEYNLTDADCNMIGFASALHDIGKILVPDTILKKPDKLTSKEFYLIKQHPVYGAELLESFVIKDNIMYRYIHDICLYHHERYDGNGYPTRIKGDDIPIWAQIVGIADVYDALVNAHIYRGAFGDEDAKEMIINGDCGCFNPKVIEAFKLTIV